ncbi:hypothetical protein D3C81_2257390 [compost metagenome]
MSIRFNHLLDRRIIKDNREGQIPGSRMKRLGKYIIGLYRERIHMGMADAAF